MMKVASLVLLAVVATSGQRPGSPTAGPATPTSAPAAAPTTGGGRPVAPTTGGGRPVASPTTGGRPAASPTAGPRDSPTAGPRDPPPATSPPATSPPATSPPATSPPATSPPAISPTANPNACNSSNCRAVQNKSCVQRSSMLVCECNQGFSAIANGCVVAGSVIPGIDQPDLSTKAPTKKATRAAYTFPPTTKGVETAKQTKTPTRAPTITACDKTKCAVPDNNADMLCTFALKGSCQSNIAAKCPHKCGDCDNCDADTLSTGVPPTPAVTIAPTSAPTVHVCVETCVDRDADLCKLYANMGLAFTTDACANTMSAMGSMCRATCLSCTKTCQDTPARAALTEPPTAFVAATPAPTTPSPTSCNTSCKNANNDYCAKLNPKSMRLMCTTALSANVLSSCERSCGPFVDKNKLTNQGCANACTGVQNPV